MARGLARREVLIDVSVNLIPILILLGFLALFAVVAPWGFGFTLATAIQVAVVVASLLGVAVLTYAAARAIEREETDRE